MKPFFSVIIPLYNKEKYIGETIKSVLNQSFKDFELIVVNDGSTDNSFEIAKKKLTSLSNCRIVSQKNSGLAATRNNGIKESRGQLIAFVDADDLWFPDFLKHIHSLHKNFPEASVYGTSYLEKYDNKTVLESKKNLDLSKEKTEFLVADFFEANMHQPIICQSSFAGKKSVFSEVRFNESVNRAVDIDWYIRVFLKHKLAYSYYPLTIIQLNIPGQMTSTKVIDKTIPDFDSYENKASNNKSLKKYLDFYRYTFLIQFKLSGANEKSKMLLEKINTDNLTVKQKILIKSPLFLLKLIKTLKTYLFKFNIRLTSF